MHILKCYGGRKEVFIGMENIFKEALMWQLRSQADKERKKKSLLTLKEIIKEQNILDQDL